MPDFGGPSGAAGGLVLAGAEAHLTQPVAHDAVFDRFSDPKSMEFRL